MKDAIDSGEMKAIIDLRQFGRETRPIHSYIQFSSEPSLMPLIRSCIEQKRKESPTKNENDDDDKILCMDFLRDYVEVHNGERYRCWSDLDREEKKRLASALSNLMLDAGYSKDDLKKLIGEVYTLEDKLPGVPDDWKASERSECSMECSDSPSWRPNQRALRDAKEFATLLNACGRHDRPMVGKAICLGDRGTELKNALREQDNHREALKKAIHLIREDPRYGIKNDKNLPNIRYFDAKDLIEDTIVGIVAGMLLGSGDIPSDKTIIAFAESLDGTCTTKVSARCTRELVSIGIDLSIAMKDASEKVGGTGGGHNIAAGATIPNGKEMDFLIELNKIISSQIKLSSL